MRKLVICGAVAFAANGAIAADLAPVYKARPMAPPVYNWSGIYFGGHLGGGWSAENDALVTAFPAAPAFPAGTALATDNLSGILGGVQGGFNWQFGGNWVIGFEGDFSWADVNGSATTGSAVLPAFSQTVNSRM